MFLMNLQFWTVRLWTRMVITGRVFRKMHPKMRVHLSTAVIFFSFLVHAVNSQYKYDCRRMEDCQNGGTCTKDDCTCTGTFGGYNCGYDTALVAACTADPSPCLNGGTCYNDGSSDLCACPYGFFGMKCENETVQIKCAGNAVEFQLAFPTDFFGKVKLGDNPECAMTESQKEQMNLYSLTVDISGDETGCNMTNIESATNGETGATEYSALFQVNYIPGITTNLDELYNLTCAHENVNIELSEDLASVGVVKENLTVSEFNETYSPVELAVLDKDGNPLTADTKLYVGDVFQLHIYLTDELAYKDVLLESCTTNNTLENDEQKNFTILDRACPTRQSKRLTKGQEVRMFEKTLQDGTVVKTSGKVVAIEAFKFVDSNNIGIVCSARVCKENDDSCAVPTNCDEVMKMPKGAAVPSPAATATATASETVTAEETAGATETAGGTETGGATEAGGATETAGATETVTASEAEAAAALEVTEVTTVTPARRRKKRAADSTEEENLVSAILTVLEPGDYKRNVDVTREVNAAEKCFAVEEITAVVAVLGTTVSVLLISCFVLTCLALKRRGKAIAFRPMPHAKAEKFQIPRAHINDSFSFGDI